MGDFNINLLHLDTDSSVQLFIDTLSSHSFYPLINKPTRITDSSQTLIDNIFTNDFSNHKTGILITDISDHFSVFMVVDQCKSLNSDKSNLTYRRNFSKDKYAKL